MTVLFSAETETGFDFDPEETARSVIEKSLSVLAFSLEAEVSVTITDAEGIRELNAEYRGIDRETDVLSFPMLEFSAPMVFSDEAETAAARNPDTGELPLGDILVNAGRVKAQAEEYGHSELREYAFLITHSILHLLGYDHETEAEEKEMFGMQEKILGELGIFR